MNEPKNCLNCGHRVKSAANPMNQFCALAGLKCATVRLFARHKDSQCDIGYNGWVPRPPTLWQLFKRLLYYIWRLG